MKLTHRRRAFLQLLAFLSCNHYTAQGEQQCILENREGKPKGILVPAAQCATFRERLENGDFHTTAGERKLVCCPVFQNEPNCGRISQNADAFSYDSRETKLDQFSWAAAILPRWSKRVLCSGTLISTRFVLSAAHCFLDESGVNKPASKYRVRLGEWDLDEDEDCMYVRGTYVCSLHHPKDYDVELIVSHGSFHRYRKDFLHDIALLKLAKTVEYSMLIGPVCLPDWSTEVPDIAGQTLFATGWGRTNAFMAFKRKYKLKMLGQKISTCSHVYGVRENEVSQVHLCARGAKRRDVCYGDSGGGLLRREADHWVQVGIISFGSRHCNRTLPGVYTNVAHYIDWIQWTVHKSLP